MKHLLIPAVLLCAASCGYEDISIKQRDVHTVVNPPDVNHDTGGDLQWMAYCLDEERALTGWCDSRGEAQSAASSYNSEHPDRKTTILWRQKPTERMIPKHPRG